MDQAPNSNDRRKLRRGVFQALLLAAIMFSSLGCYLIVLKWRGPAAAVKTNLPVDDWFPYWPSWVIVYLAPYVVGPVLVGMLSRSTFWWFVCRGLVVIGITLAIFIVFPTQTDATMRQQEIGDGLIAKIFKQMTEIDDPPANAAPSLHVSLTCLLLLAMMRDFPRGWPLWTAGVGMVWLSTLVTRQHHLIDVATGVLMTFAVVWASGGVYRRRPLHRIGNVGQ